MAVDIVARVIGGDAGNLPFLCQPHRRQAERVGRGDVKQRRAEGGDLGAHGAGDAEGEAVLAAAGDGNRGDRGDGAVGFEHRLARKRRHHHHRHRLQFEVLDQAVQRDDGAVLDVIIIAAPHHDPQRCRGAGVPEREIRNVLVHAPAPSLSTVANPIVPALAAIIGRPSAMSTRRSLAAQAPPLARNSAFIPTNFATYACNIARRRSGGCRGSLSRQRSP